MKMLVINKSMTVEHFDKFNFTKYNKKKKSQFRTTLQKEFHKRESFQRTILRSCRLIKMVYLQMLLSSKLQSNEITI